MSTAEHIHPDLRHILGLSDRERLAYLDEPRWIGYPLAQRTLTTLRGLMEKPARPRMPNLLLVGEPNNGKTTIIRRFQTLYGEGYVNEDAEPVKPIILTDAPPTADEKGLYVAILEQFWTPYRASDAALKLRHQVIHLMRNCHVRVLVIDEFHSLLTGTATKQREVMNAIKLLCNTLAIPIIGAGTREAVHVLHTDPQHASRFDVLTLPTWDLNRDFQLLLTGFEQVLPLKKPSHLHEPELATSLHSISQGNIGNLHRLLVECANAAITSGTEQIDKASIESKAWLRPTHGIREVRV